MKLITVLFLQLLSVLVFAQTCNTSMVNSNGEGRFVNLNNGYVLDVITMLKWEYCSHGQTYEDGFCYGAPSHYDDFSAALLAANEVEAHRIPNIKELGTLISRECVDPAIDQSIFPDTPLYVYWSSTPGETGEGLIIDFTDGSEIIRDINRPKVIRLISD